MILELADFLDSMVVQVLKQKPSYIEDDNVLVHYYDLLNKKEIDRNESTLLPVDNLSKSITNYLVVCINLDVCYNALAGNLNVVLENADNDPWTNKKDAYLEYKDMLLSTISNNDFFIDGIIPEDSNTDSSSVFEWVRS